MGGRGLLPARICRDTQEEEQEPCLEGTSPPDVPCQEKGRADGFFLANFNVLRKPLSGRDTQHSVLCVLINSETCTLEGGFLIRWDSLMRCVESGELRDLSPQWVSVCGCPLLWPQKSALGSHSHLRTSWPSPQLDFHGGEGSVKRETSPQLG